MNRYGTGVKNRTVIGVSQPCRAGNAKTCQGCRMDESPLLPLPLAMAYVPVQTWGETYLPEKALCRGTLFPVLDLPFLRGGNCQ